MNPEKIVQTTNRVAVIAVVLLAYWVFAFVSIWVFGFRVFRENITQAYYMSILGILALLLGAVVLNVMANLTQIAQAVGPSDTSGQPAPRNCRLITWGVVASFPLLFVLLYWGDYQSARVKEASLIAAARSLVAENPNILNDMARYEFSKEYVDRTSSNLKILSGIDENFPQVNVIVRDQINQKPVLLRFGRWSRTSEEDLDKANYIYAASEDERTYINEVLDSQGMEVRFSAHDGSYELYFPVDTSPIRLILYLSDRQKYGKFGS